MIEQATLFDAHESASDANPPALVKPVADGAQLPPVPPKPVVQAEPLGKCAKAGCDEPGVLKSPGGSVYCSKHGYCSRKTCLKSVEKFVWHERLGIYVCPCVLVFEERIAKREQDRAEETS